MAAIAVTGVIIAVSAGGLVGAILDRNNVIFWGGLSLVAGLVAAHYVMSIRWADFNQAWPRHRTGRRRRSHSL
jgi:hypothetical protein